MLDRGTVIVIRHAESQYPKDFLSEIGIRHAQEARTKIGQLIDIVCSSPQVRAVQTAEFISGSKPRTDIRFSELEISSVNAPTPRGYVEVAHQSEPDLVATKGKQMVSAVRDMMVRGRRVLIVSHNLAISALYQQLTGEIYPVNNLEGFKLSVGMDGLITICKRVSFK